MARRTRIGRKMDLARAICHGRPMAVIDVAARVGPHGSLCYGYAIVHRAIRAGVVRLTDTIPGRRGMCIIAS